MENVSFLFNVTEKYFYKDCVMCIYIYIYIYIYVFIISLITNMYTFK